MALDKNFCQSESPVVWYSVLLWARPSLLVLPVNIAQAPGHLAKAISKDTWQILRETDET